MGSEGLGVVRSWGIQGMELSRVVQYCLQLPQQDLDCTMVPLTHVVHLGPVPSYPKCPMAQWDRMGSWD